MRSALIIFLSIIFIPFVSGQTRRELEDQRKKTLEEITNVDNLLKQTEKEKNSGINQLKIVGNKLHLRENVISGIKQEIELLTERIELNSLAINLMEKDLVSMKRDYAKTIVNSYKARKGNPEIGYILSAQDFNQGYKRLKYLQQVTKFRHQQAELIIELREEIEKSKVKLQEDLNNISDLKKREEGQKSLIQQEQNRQNQLVNSLGTKEKQLQKELDEKRRIAQKIEAEISKLIEEEKKKALKSELTPEMKLIGESFAENKGRLPWPVEKGTITSKFGLQQHPVLSYVTEDNIGIEITNTGKTKVRSIFKGQVMKVFAISGANWGIIIRHGKYLTVYQNLVNVTVKQGELVDLKQDIGDVFCDVDNGSKSVLKFMIFQEKYLDPEIWISKKK
jgi:septal ring factor EnvC (AmiA/AmiB activator)